MGLFLGGHGGRRSRDADRGRKRGTAERDSSSSAVHVHSPRSPLWRFDFHVVPSAEGGPHEGEEEDEQVEGEEDEGKGGPLREPWRLSARRLNSSDPNPALSSAID